MKHFAILSFFILFNFPAFCQNIDSISNLVRQYDYQGALEAIEKCDTGCPDSRLLYFKAVSLKAMSKFPEAIACYDSIYKSDSANIGVIVEMADCYKAIMNYQKPLELYEKALNVRPVNHYIMQLLAGIYVTLEKFREAGQYYQQACSNDTSGFLLKQIGLCYEKIMEDELAIDYYNKAIQWSPGDYQPVFRLANLYKNKLEFELGIGVADSFSSRGYINRDVLRLSGYLHYLNQDFPAAIDRFGQSLELGDTSSFVNKYLGYSYFKQNEFAGAIKCLEKVFAVDSSDAELCYALGLAHDPPENIRYFNAAINIGLPVVNMLSIVHQDLALALTKNYQYTDALTSLLKALELTPHDPAVLYKIGVHYDNWMDDKATAVKYYSEFLASRSGNTDMPYVITSTSVITQEDYNHADRRIRDIESIYMVPPVVASDTTRNQP